MERPTVEKVVTKLSAVKYHPQYEDSLKQEREMAQQEIAQVKEKLKSKEEFILIQKHNSQEEIKKLQQQCKEKDVKISEFEAWKKNIKDKITSLASAAEQHI